MDQRGFDNQRQYLPATEAARFLDVGIRTLYAYVSRGMVRTVRDPRGAGKQYSFEDLSRLRARRDARAGHGPVAAGALRWGEPVLESAITDIDQDGPSYRGKPAHELAGSNTSFEQVAELLWTGQLPDGMPPPPPKLPGRLPTVPRGATRFAALAMAIASLDANDPDRLASSPANILPRARAVVRRLAAALALGVRPAHVKRAIEAPNTAAAVAIALGMPSMKHVRAVNQALILLADHELNASTFAARVAASAGADLYACVSAGLAAASGVRHGAASAQVEALVNEVERPENARRVIADRARRGEAMPGFGHHLYPDGDPRAKMLFEIAQDIAKNDRKVRTLVALAKEMKAAGREPPNVDAALVALTCALRLPPGSASGIFIVGRSAGWIAHALEQRASGVLLRPRARYIGTPLTLGFTPAELTG